MAKVTYTKEEREQKRSERLALLDRAVEELTSSEAWASWLEVRRKFHAYSWRNQLMITIQAPQTIAVRGMRQWKELGRQVKKGSKAIWILAPAPFKTGELDDNGEPKRKMYFKPVAVFAYEDTEQIEGAKVVDLEPPLRPIEGDDLAAELEQLGWWLTHEGGVTEVRFEPIPGHAHGWYQPGTKTIAVDEDLSVNHRFKTLVHEAAHHLVRRASAEHGWNYDTEEIVVESTAYAVSATFGLETAGYSAGYVASWQKDGPKPADLVAVVDELATTIEEAIRELAPSKHGDANSDGAPDATEALTRDPGTPDRLDRGTPAGTPRAR